MANPNRMERILYKKIRHFDKNGNFSGRFTPTEVLTLIRQGATGATYQFNNVRLASRHIESIKLIAECASRAGITNSMYESMKASDLIQEKFTKYWSGA